MVKYLWTAAKEVTNTDTPNAPDHEQNSLRWNVQNEMFEERMFCSKCLFRVLGPSDESFWKASYFCLKSD